MEQVVMKKCRKCGEEKPGLYDYFPWKRKEKGQLDGRCRTCKNVDDLKRYYTRGEDRQEKDKERNRLRAAKKRAAKPEYFKALEAKRKKSENHLLWKYKERERNKERAFLNKVGSFCELRLFKCRVCSDSSIRKGDDESTLCKHCTTKRLYVKGLKMSIKTACCKACGEEHLSKNKNAYCPQCRDARTMMSERKWQRSARAKKRDVHGSFRKRCVKHGVMYTQLNRPDVYVRDNWSCVYCGIRVVRSKTYQPNQATIDHVIPLSKGGTHTMDNVVTACQVCNSNKSDVVQLKQKKTNQLLIWLR